MKSSGGPIDHDDQYEDQYGEIHKDHDSLKDSPEDTRPVEDFKVLELGRKKDEKLKKMEQETEAKIRKIIQQSRDQRTAKGTDRSESFVGPVPASGPNRSFLDQPVLVRGSLEQSIQHYFHEFANPDDDISTYYFRDHPDSLHSEMADGINQWDDVREDLSHSRAAERLVKNLNLKKNNLS